MNVKGTIKNRLKMTLIMTFIGFLTVIGLTYAYFISTFNTNTQDKDVIVNAGKLELTYFDGNGTIVLDKLMPGETIETKTFNVKNTGTSYIDDYDVNLDKLENELNYYEDLTYTLTCKEYDINDNYIDDCNGQETEKTFPQADANLTTNSLEIGHIQKYELKIVYKETYKDQSDDMDKVVKARVAIVDNSEVYVE